MKHFTLRFASSLSNRYVLWCLLIVALYTMFDIVTTFMAHRRLFYMDTDAYTRALRIIDWLSNFQWAEKIYPYSNYPYGDVLHFTRINDVIWGAFSLPFWAIFPLKEAVFYGGFVFSPFFLFLSATTIVWGVKPCFAATENDRKAFMFGFIFMFIFIIKLTNIFAFTRPDHHSLMFFIYCFNLSMLLRTAKSGLAIKLFFIAGLLSAFGVWASSAIEGLLAAGSILLCLCLNWIFFQSSVKKLVIYTGGLFIGTFSAYVINPPLGGYFEADNSRLTLIHVILTLLMLMSFATIPRIKPTSILSKIGSLVGCALISFTILYLCFGRSLFTPIYTPNVLKYLVSQISEMQPNNVIDNIFGVLMLITGGVLLKFNRDTFLINLIILFVLFFTAGIFVTRFMHYALPCAVYLNFYALITGFRIINQNKLCRPLLFTYILIIYTFFLSFQSQNKPLTEQTPALSGCVLTDLFIAPQVAFDRDVFVIGTPSHTNDTALTDTRTMWITENEEQLKSLLIEHQVTYVYLRKSEQNKKFCAASTGNNLETAVVCEKISYPWLVKQSAPTDNYHLYKVLLKN